MTARIENLLEKIRNLMQDHLAEKRDDSLVSLSPLLERAKRLQRQYGQIEQELLDVELGIKRFDSDNIVPNPKFSSDLHSLDKRNGRAKPKTLRVTIDWRANGRKKEKEVINSNIAANALAECISKLIAEFGDSALRKLLEMRVNRGPLISRSPQRDFSGYQCRRIPGTDCFLLTNNSTAEKVDILENVSRILGLTPGSVKIESVERFNFLDGFNE